MPTADHSTTCVRGQKTICIPCSQEQYEPIVDNPKQFRRLLDQLIHHAGSSQTLSSGLYTLRDKAPRFWRTQPKGIRLLMTSG